MLQLYDPNGTLTLDLTTPGVLAKILGTAQIGYSYTGTTQSANIFNSGFTYYPGHSPFVALLDGGFPDRDGIAPYFQFPNSGQYLNWTFPTSGDQFHYPNTTFIYGIAQSGTANVDAPAAPAGAVVGQFYDNSGRIAMDLNTIGWFCRYSAQTTTQSTSNYKVGQTVSSIIIMPSRYLSKPIAAFTCEGYGIAYAGKDGNNQLVFATDAPPNTPVDTYLFDIAPTLPDSAAMLKLYDQNSTITYNSDFRPMIVRQLIQASDNGSGTGDVGYSGRRMAAATTTWGGHRIAGQALCYDSGGPQLPDDGNPQYCGDIRYTNDGKLYGGCTYNNSQIVRVKAISFDDVSVRAGNSNTYVRPPDWERPATVFAVDVTNIPQNLGFIY